MFYLLEVYASLAAAVVVATTLITLTLFAWSEGKAYVTSRRSMPHPVANLANPLANSRSLSRSDVRVSFTQHKIQ